MKYFKKIAILGIPNMSARADIPRFKDGQWGIGVHGHFAERAGHHYDLRLGDPEAKKAYSWAIRHWPAPGEKRLAIRQPDHTMAYINFSGWIPKGYGAGRVDLLYKGKAFINKAKKNKINFMVDKSKFTLIHTKDNNWLILNRK